jgi:tRNA(Arg) A34 adenosine deaminase TadA
MILHHHFEMRLPDWIDGFVGHWLNERGVALETAEHRMQLAIALSAENVRQKTGGPFGAVVVQQDTGRLVGVGVNLVTQLQISAAHAEIVALTLAQRAAGSWNLAEVGAMQLATSCEPCAMCFGAIPWAGLDSVICGARKEDAEDAGFDEGDKPASWTKALQDRGMHVKLDVLRDSAARVLQDYAQADGTIYNPGQA